MTITHRVRRFTAPLLLMPLLGACAAGITYNHDFDPSANFTQLHTYIWAQAPAGDEPRGVNPLIERRVVAAIDSQLAAKGYTLSNSGEGDFAVNFTITTSQQTDYNTYYTGMGYYGGWYGGMGMGSSSTHATVTTNGTFIMDIFDTRTRNLIWRGTAKGTVEPEASMEQREIRIREAVAGVLQPFPNRNAAGH
jgi:uncharacterized protein DUF4136